jgi:hypothetical protein
VAARENRCRPCSNYFRYSVFQMLVTGLFIRLPPHLDPSHTYLPALSLS